MSRITELFGALLRSRKAPSQNREGYPAWARSVEEQYLQTLLTNTFGQTFYASQKEMVAEAVALHDAMLATDPAFAARALGFARSRGFMRAQPIYGLARLAAVPGPHFEAAFGEVVHTPSDLMDFAAVVKSLRGGEGGRRIKRVAGRWLVEKLSEYWAVKYGAAKEGTYTLSDLLRVYHPRVATKMPLVDWLRGRAVALESLPQVAAFERLKRAVSDEEKVAAIAEGRLPHEVATVFAGRSQKVWAAIARELPVFALLRHLATLERHGVVDQVREAIAGKLANPSVIARSKILPFRFLDAAEKVRTPWLRDVLRDALERAFANVPELLGRTAVLLDRSGSMASYVRTAALFGVCLMKKAKLDGRLLLFDDRVEEMAVSLRDSLLTQAERVTARGGTATALPVEMLTAERERVDNIVLITDEQQNTGMPFIDALDRYRKKVNPGVRTFVIDVAPYREALTPADPLTFFVYGWSEQALSFVSLASRGWGSLVESVRGGRN